MRRRALSYNALAWMLIGSRPFLSGLPSFKVFHVITIVTISASARVTFHNRSQPWHQQGRQVAFCSQPSSPLRRLRRVPSAAGLDRRSYHYRLAIVIPASRGHHVDKLTSFHDRRRLRPHQKHQKRLRHPQARPRPRTRRTLNPKTSITVSMVRGSARPPRQRLPSRHT